ncbi:GNAT family N-acetyltransferase [Aquibacillus koreensis]|uniref:GNAT family N-acetyltransferase n=1 Tax=Aquibacillus koreensis TaxID=279446 RepID=A0A9X4AJD1_9BACI|nr:GNAT family N-acetyltransferase [Aquibacillus koreensis]MCT2535825.1 GNAT family N-acetyltransferase [Aquibacillus koreensis]MDC3420280.1 GNAT family N-acetyltransferase [Aquibacillus koreensis]
MQIRVDDLSGEKVRQLIMDHLKNMELHSPPESRHALSVDGLRGPKITFWSAWEEEELLGCGALKELDRNHGEIKSMKTATAHLRKGVSKTILQHIIMVAQDRGYRRLSLETGSMDAFMPARKLYESQGFQYCPPFSDYKKDPNSLFMTKEI